MALERLSQLDHATLHNLTLRSALDKLKAEEQRRTR